MQAINTKDYIDISGIIIKIWKKKKLFYIVLPVAFILSSLLIISVPRYYVSDTRIAPEMENSMGGGTLGSIASSFGINLNDMQSSDAITPILYPELMDDNKFIFDLFGIHVESADGTIKTTYYEYLRKHQKTAWWNYPKKWLLNLLPKKKDITKGKGKSDPYQLSKIDNDIAEAIRSNITLNMDKKTGVVTIMTKAQDPFICKALADTMRLRLQAFITDYRTNKARIDYAYYLDLTAEAKRNYEKARQLYGSYADANTDVMLESFRSKQNDLENDMQLKYNTYTALNTQLQAAKAKVQERTPAFTMIKGAAVPVKPAGPKRMIFVLGMLILSFFCTIGYILKDEILGALASKR